MELHCDCGAVLECPEDFFSGGAKVFWQLHGHFPLAVILRCACGAEQRTGERYHQNALLACALDTAFYCQHQPHDAVDPVPPSSADPPTRA